MSGRKVAARMISAMAKESLRASRMRNSFVAVTIALASSLLTVILLFALGQNTITASKFDFNTSILILVFVVLGGQGRMWGSIIAAALLTILPEALREFADYRMLVYAIVLILVMLATNNPTLQSFFTSLFRKNKRKEAAGK